MSEFDRRTFLRWLAAGASLGFLRACGLTPNPSAAPLPIASSVPPTPTAISPTAAASALPVEPGTDASPQPTSAPQPTATPSPLADLAVARGGEPEDLVRRAMAAIGGMERFVRPGDEVIVKPNICVAYHSYEYAATTNPWVVATLVRLALEAGARRVRVMDYPFGGSADEAYRRSGIQEHVQSAGGEMEIMSRFKFLDTEIPAGQSLRRCDIYDEALNADVLINVPIAKHHNLAWLTLGMKNLMGVIWDRPAMHANLGQRLADLTSRIRPALTVVDAVRVLTDHGPTGGNLEDVRQLDTVIASPDIVAADSYAATLMGVQPDALDYVRAATAMGLGRSDLENLLIAEV